MADLEQLHTAELLALHFEQTTSDEEYRDPVRRRVSERTGYAVIRIDNYLAAARRQQHSLSRLTRQIGVLRDELSLDSGREYDTRRRIFDLAGQRETQLHFIATCISQIGTYLQIMVRTCGVEAGKATLSSRDMEFFEHFGNLRDHFEHFEQRLPGTRATSKSPGEASILIHRNASTSTYGIHGDATGRISIGEDSWDISFRTLRQIQQIVRRVDGAVRAQAIEQLRESLGPGAREKRVALPYSVLPIPYPTPHGT